MKRLIVFMSLFGLAIFLDSLFNIDVVYQYAIAPLVLGAAILGGSTLLGTAVSGYLNNKSVDKANEMNMNLAQNTNNMNREMFNEQMEYNKYMYEDQKAYNNELISKMNDYNSPVAQRQRLEQAGYNPYLAYGNVDAGSMQSAISPSPAAAPSAPSLQTAHVQPKNYDFVGQGLRDIGSIMNGYFQNSNIAADTITKSIDNVTRLDENIARLEGLRANNELTKARKQELDEQITNLREMRSYQLEQLRLQNENLMKDSKSKTIEQEQRSVDIRISKLQERYQQWFNSWSKNKGAKEIQQLNSMIQNIDEDTKFKANQKLTEESRKHGIDIDNYQKRELLDIIVDGSKLDNEQKRLNNKYGNNAYTSFGRWLERANKKKGFRIPYVMEYHD